MPAKPPSPSPRHIEAYELVVTTGVTSRELGALLRAVRMSVGKSLQELGAVTGIAHQNLSRIERGETEAMLSTIRRYLDALGWQLVVTAEPKPGHSAAPAPPEGEADAPQPAEDAPGRAERPKGTRPRKSLEKKRR